MFLSRDNFPWFKDAPMFAVQETVRDEPANCQSISGHRSVNRLAEWKSKRIGQGSVLQTLVQ